MKNLLFNLKVVQTEVGAGAGPETNSFGSSTLEENNKYTGRLQQFFSKSKAFSISRPRTYGIISIYHLKGQ